MAERWGWRRERVCEHSGEFASGLTALVQAVTPVQGSLSHTPSLAFHKDVVSQCLDFGVICVCVCLCARVRACGVCRECVCGRV